MKYVMVLLALVFLFGLLGYAQNATTDDHPSGFMTQGVKEQTVKSTAASVPNKISYQGILTTSGGTPVSDGAYDITFELFNVAVSGAALWSETQTGVVVTNGTFSVLLGNVTPLISIFHEPLWIEVTAVSGPGIAAPIVFTPRTELASAAYSLGPVLRYGDDYYIESNLGIGQYPEPPYSLDVIKSSGSYIRAKSTGFYAALIADKGMASSNNYLILRTGGFDRWTLGTVGSDNFALGYWPGGYKSYLYVDTLGKVGIGTTSPDKLLEVAGSAKVKDTLFIGSGIPVAHANDWLGYGGQVAVNDEEGNLIAELRANGNGKGGGVRAFNDAGIVGFEGWGNAYGSGQGYLRVYGNSRQMIVDTRYAGDQSVQLPDSSISSAEMFNEPGVAASYGPSFYSLANVTTNQRIDSVTINVPAAGKIIAEANGYLNLTHTNGVIDNIGIHVLTDPAGAVYENGCSRVYVPSELPTAYTYTYNFACKNIFNVSVATSLKIYLIVRQYSGGDINLTDIAYSSLIATYYPTVYGNTPVVLSNIPQGGVNEGSAESSPNINIIYQTPEEFNAQAADEFKRNDTQNEGSQKQGNGAGQSDTKDDQR